MASIAHALHPLSRSGFYLTSGVIHLATRDNLAAGKAAAIDSTKPNCQILSLGQSRFLSSILDLTEESHAESKSRCCAQEGRLRFSFTRGFSRVIGSVRREGKPFKRFSDLGFAQFTWPKARCE